MCALAESLVQQASGTMGQRFTRSLRLRITIGLYISGSLGR